MFYFCFIYSHPEQAGLDSACQLCESLIDSVSNRQTSGYHRQQEIDEIFCRLI